MISRRSLFKAIAGAALALAAGKVAVQPGIVVGADFGSVGPTFVRLNPSALAYARAVRMVALADAGGKAREGQ